MPGLRHNPALIMAAIRPAHRLSEAEYLAIERETEFKSEFYDGEMFAMAGGSPRHNLIASNLNAELRNALKGRPCVAFNSDMRLKIEATGLLTYSDVSVICGRIQTPPDVDDVILNPV